MTLFRPAQDSEAGLGARHMLVAPVFPLLSDLPWCYEHGEIPTRHRNGEEACVWSIEPGDCRIGTARIYPQHPPKEES